jgi:hypothetical protein
VRQLVFSVFQLSKDPPNSPLMAIILRQVHNMVLLSAIQKEHHNAMQDFEGFMLSCAEADWEKHQQTHGFAGMGGGGGGGGFSPMDTAMLLEPATPAAKGLFADTPSSQVRALSWAEG